MAGGPGRSVGAKGLLRVANLRADGGPSSVASFCLQLLVTFSTSGCLRFSSSMNTCHRRLVLSTHRP